MNTLLTIQQKLKAPKSQFNKFGNYNYRNCEDILEAVKPLLAETNSTLILTDNVALVGSKVFVVATAVLTDKEGKQVTASAYACHADEQKGMADAQITGSASSYARKYALNGLFLIDDTKDADTTNDGTKVATKAEAKKTEATKKPTEWLNPATPQWDHTLKRVKEGMTIDDVKKFFLISKANEEKLKNEAK